MSVTTEKRYYPETSLSDFRVREFRARSVPRYVDFINCCNWEIGEQCSCLRCASFERSYRNYTLTDRMGHAGVLTDPRAIENGLPGETPLVEFGVAPKAKPLDHPGSADDRQWASDQDDWAQCLLDWK